MRQLLVHGLATLLLVVSIGAGVGRVPICSGSVRTESTKGKSNEQSAQPGRSISRKSFEVGAASWYREQFDGKATASGEHFDMYALTAVVRVNESWPPRERTDY
jgi:rare lipoprotein A (peptidoglycan hydrolase)